MNAKVLMILPEFLPSVGGTEKQALTISKALIQLGSDVSILTRMGQKDWPEKETIEGVPVCRVNYPRIRVLGGCMLNLAFAWKLLSDYKNKEVIHFHIGGSHMLLPFVVAKILRKVTVIKICGWWEMEKGFLRPGGILRGCMRKILFQSDVLISLGTDIQKRMETLGCPVSQIAYMPNGVDTTRFYPTKTNTNNFEIVFVGRLVKEKGLSTLLGAIHMLKKSNPKVRLSIVGSGPEVTFLENLVSQLDLHDNVIFIGPRDDVETYLRKSDIYVQPSLSEGLPNSLLEAMACGLPVVVSNIGGMPDVVKNGIEGFIVEPENISQLAKAIEDLCADNLLRERMGKAGFKKVDNEFGLEKIASKYIELYLNAGNRCN